MDGLEQDINADLAQNARENKRAKFDSFEKMTKTNLAKQEKPLLISFAESKGLLDGMTDRQKERMNRKELAELIKGGHKSTETKQKTQNNTQGEQEHQKYINAFFGYAKRQL